ncbi:hypothetical protein, partial [Cylindrospermopsis raciborskii]|uniref:hypothetical protein n=1 Tax=Cylindrospermopsis raciborskii TaxID=77022 RepID=UPI0038D10D52
MNRFDIPTLRGFVYSLLQLKNMTFQFFPRNFLPLYILLNFPGNWSIVFPFHPQVILGLGHF